MTMAPPPAGPPPPPDDAAPAAAPYPLQPLPLRSSRRFTTADPLTMSKSPLLYPSNTMPVTSLAGGLMVSEPPAFAIDRGLPGIPGPGPTRIVCPASDGANVISSAPVDESSVAIAARRVPGPESAVLVTSMVVAPAAAG